MYAETILDMIVDKYGFEVKRSQDGSVIRYTIDGVVVRVKVGGGIESSYGVIQDVKVMEYRMDDGVWYWARVDGFRNADDLYGVRREQAILGFVVDQMMDLGEHAARLAQRTA